MKPGLRVLLVAEYYGSGGTRTYLRQLLNFYARQNSHVTLVSLQESLDVEVQGWLARFGFDSVSYASVVRSAELEDGMSRPAVWSVLGMRKERRSFQSLAKRISAEKIVISAGTPGMFLGALGATPDGLYILHTYPHGRRQEILGPHVMSRFLPRGSTIVSVSDFEKVLINRLWRPKNRACTVETLKNTCGEPLPLIHRTGSPFHVLTASWLEEYKQPMQWIEIAEEIIANAPRGEVIFTWLGEGSLLESARQRVKDSPYSSWINFPGMQTHVHDWYVEASLYLQLSTIENMSLSTIDAQRYGLPCVVTNVGGLPEIVSDGVSGRIIPVGDIGAATDAINEALHSPEVRAQFSKAARENYLREHAQTAWECALVKLHTGD